MEVNILPITAVISFCSNDWRFLKRCVDEVSPFCNQILITVCDHFFDGSEENYALLEEAYLSFPVCTFLEFHFDPEKSYNYFSTLCPSHRNFRHEWHNTGRWLGFLHASPETEFFLFLDSDEIFDGELFLKWQEQIGIKQYSAMRFAAYYHFREAKFEAIEQDDFSLLVKKESLQSEFFWNLDERFGLFHLLQGEKKLGVRGVDGKPMVRHYSGVRTKEELQKKLGSWGHHWERDWERLLNEEYSRSFNGKDFIRRYTYQTVPTVFDPMSVEVPSLPFVSLEDHRKRLHRFKNVHIISREEAFRRDLKNEFAISH